MKKGFLTTIIAVVMAMMLIPVMAITANAAETDTWDGTAVSQAWESGSGTGDNPYIIMTAEQLAKLAADVNGGTTYASTYFKLGANLDLAGATYNWTPIGKNSSSSFKGVFDGDGHTISNLKITSDQQYVGMFGYVNGGTIKNIVLESPDVSTTYSTANASVGALVGYHSNSGNIEYCAVRNGSVSAPNSTCANTYSGLGGVVGCHNTSGKVIGCYNYMTDVSTKDNTMTRCGGVAGSVNNAAESCYTYNTAQKGITPAGNFESGSGSGYMKYCVHLKADGTESSALSTSINSAALSAEEFANGTAAYFLRTGMYSNVDNPWGQNIEGDTKETMPVWNGAKVFPVQWIQDVEGTGTLVTIYANELETKEIDGKTYRVIYDVYDWVLFANLVNTNSGNNYLNRAWNAIVEPAGATIDFSALGTLAYHSGSWKKGVTIGNSSNTNGFYNGTFNGNGCTITGLKYESTYSYGNYSLFGYIGTEAHISNITVENASLTSTTNHYLATFVRQNRGVFENCHAVNSTVSIMGSGGDGGGFAYDNRGTIKNCSFSGSLVTPANAGGIASTASSGAQFINCWNEGSISGKTTSAGYGNYTGGILGEEAEGVIIDHCYNTGDITGYYAGGIVGSHYGYGTVSNCHSYDAVLNGTRTSPIARGAGVSNCYYLADSETDTIDGTTYKTAEEFRNGTVAALLNGTGSVWKQGADHPEIKELVYYRITVNAAENGTVVASKSTAAEGDIVTLTVTPAENYAPTSIIVTDADGNPVAVADNKFTMPAKAVTVEVIFKEATYTVTFAPGEGEGTMVQQSIGSITPVALNSNTFTRKNYDFAGWKDENDNTYTDGQVITLTANITLTAQWKAKEYGVTYTVTNATIDAKPEKLAYGTDGTWTFTANTGFFLNEACVTVTIGGNAYTGFTTTPDGNGVTLNLTVPGTDINGDVVITVKAKNDPCDIEIAPAQNGTVSSNVPKASEGDQVSLLVNPGEFYELGTITVEDENGNPVPVAEDNTFIMPATKVTVTVTFVKPDYATKKELQEAISELEEKLNKLDETFATDQALKDEVDALKAEIILLKAADADIAEKIAQINQAIADLENVYAKKTELEAAKTELQAAIDKKADITTLDAKVQQLQTAIESAEAAAKAYADTKDTALKQQLETAIANAKQEAINAADSALTQAKTELNAAIAKKADITALENAISDLNAAITLAQTTAQNFATDADAALKLALEAEIENTKTALSSAVSELERQVKANEEKIAEIKKNLEDAVEKLDKADAKNAEELVKAVDKLNKAIDEAKAAAVSGDKALEAKLATAEKKLNEKIAQVQNNLDKVSAELDAAIKSGDKALAEKIAALQAELATTKELLEKANAKNYTELAAKLESANKVLDEAIKAVQKNLDDAKAELDKAITDGDTALEGKISDLNAALAAAKEALLSADAKNKSELIDKIEKTYMTLDAAVKTVQKNLDDAKAELDKAIADGDTALEGKISDLNAALAAAKEALISADAENKAELTGKIEEISVSLDAAVKTVQKNLDKTKSELKKAIKAGDAALEAKIADLNEALAAAKAAFETANTDTKAELTAKIDEAYNALDAAIKALQGQLDDVKAELEDKDRALEAKTDELKTMLIIVAIISGITLCGGATFVIWFFYDRKKKA